MKKTTLKGQTFTNNRGMICVVLKDIYDSNKSRCLVQFLNTGYKTEVFKQNLLRGIFTDPYEKTIYGVACKGKIRCLTNHQKIAFHRWSAMISRCYNPNDINYHNYGAKGITVSDDWLIFENYYQDLPHIKGYNEDLWFKHQIELDKDLGNTNIYSFQTTQFISKLSNNLLQSRNNKPFKAISPNGEEYIYTNQTICGKELRIPPRSIGKCLHKQLNQTHRYRFEYLEPQTTIPEGSNE